MLRVLFVRLLTLSLLSVSLGWPLTPASARTIQFVPPQTDEKADPRDRPRGGGSRPICSQANDLTCVEEAMIALVLSSNLNGLTLSATPTLWFYSPYKSDPPIQASFELANMAGDVVWQSMDFPLMSQPGIFSYQIPAEANLESGQTYRWYLTVHLDRDQPAADVLLSARITYRNSTQLSGSAIEQVQTLANQGIWYDTVTAIAQLHLTEPALWDTFLIEHGFSSLVKQPVHL